MTGYTLAALLVVVYGAALLYALGMTIAAGKVSLLGYIPMKGFVLIGAGFIAMTAITVGVTMYAIRIQPSWWANTGPLVLPVVIASILIGICVMATLSLLGREIYQSS